MKDSYEKIHRSDFFSFDSGMDLFYSYSKCNSTADDWLEEIAAMKDDALKNIDIRANVPGYVALEDVLTLTTNYVNYMHS